MHSELIPGLPFQSFGLCAALGILFAWLLAERLYKSPDIGNLVFILVFSGLIGARIAHVIQFYHEDGFDKDFMSAFYLWKGGLVFYGGFLLAAINFFIWCYIKRPDLLRLANVLCVCLPLGHAFGRIGCFMHGCCWGKVSDSCLAVTFPAGSPVWGAHHHSYLSPRSLPVLPTQLFEAFALFALFAVLFFVYRKYKNYTAALYLIGYAIIRFFIEFLRDDPRPELSGLSSAQGFSIILVLVGIAFFVWSYKRNAEFSHDNR